MFLQNPLSYDPNNWTGEINEEPSMTVPDESLTVRQIIDRFTRGVPLGVSMYKPEFDDDGTDDDPFPDPRSLDLAEREELRERYTEYLDSLNKASKAEKDSQRNVKGKKADDKQSDSDIVDVTPEPES